MSKKCKLLLVRISTRFFSYILLFDESRTLNLFYHFQDKSSYIISDPTQIVRNAVIDTILTRRSVRKFTQEQVTKETLKLLLMAAMQAPSACNQQARYYMVITNREKIL